jgi:Mg2+ and Co2+ transporter CorA
MHSLIVSQNGAFHNDLDSTALIAALATPTDVIWLDIQDPSEEDIALLRDVFGFHPLAIEDAVRSHERPKVDAYAPAAGGRTGARLQNILREMDILHQRDQANEDTAPGDADAPTQRREQIETAGPGSYYFVVF